MFWLTISMLPCLIGFFYVEPVLKFLGFPENVAEVAGTYAIYNIVWPIPNGLYQCMRFYFQAQGLPRPAMYNNISFLFVNAMLNWVFVFGGPFRYIFGWKGLGFIGAAISLSISRTMQSVVYFFYMFVYKKNHINTWPDAGLSLQHHTLARTTEFMRQSIPNLGTLLFSVISSQATTVLVGRLGERAIAASSALSTVTIPWSGTMGATTCTISGVRVGYHLGRGDGNAAKRTAWMIMHFISIVMVAVTILFVPLQHWILKVATDDYDVLSLSIKLIPAMLVGTYLNLLVSNITSGVFSGMGRPIIATILSFGFELPMSIGGVAVYILYFHGDLLGVYWWGAISGAIEVAVVLGLLFASDWDHWALEAQRRQEARPSEDDADEQDNADTAAPSMEETVPLVVVTEDAEAGEATEVEGTGE
jgi:MATE family multidrug resistance protein